MQILLISNWTSLVLYASILIIIAVAMLVISYLLGPKRYRKEKFSPYECGVPLLDDTRKRFSVKFYLIAILFILFDIETVFLIPWAVVFRSLGWLGIVEMLTFVGVLGFGWRTWWARRRNELMDGISNGEDQDAK